MNRTELLPDRPGIPPMAQLPEAEEIDINTILDSYENGEIDLIAVVGPTASGKTKYAVRLAERINSIKGRKCAEILSADSRQVFVGMDIGTGKDLKEYGSIPYHLIDIVPAGTRYSIFEYQQAFEKAYKDVRDRNCVPILCGGSGLYIEAATCGYSLPQIPPDDALREELFELDHEELKNRLLDLKPDTDESTLESKRRTVRAIEVALYEKSNPVVRSAFLPKNTYFIGTLVSREERVAKIDKRLDERLEEGMAEEVRTLINSGVPAEDLVYYGLEYKYVTQYVLGILSLDNMRTLLSNAIHQFAKRQMTWFRGMERKGFVIHWIKV